MVLQSRLGPWAHPNVEAEMQHLAHEAQLRADLHIQAGIPSDTCNNAWCGSCPEVPFRRLESLGMLRLALLVL